MTTTPSGGPIAKGDVLGRWTVLDPAAGRRPGGRRQTLALCRCSCGAELLVLADNLLGGRSRGCLGCSRSARRVGAELIPDPAARGKWLNCRRNMLARCHDPAHAKYPAYGGRGVAVCGAWRDDPLAFLRWVAAQPSHTDPEMTVDRLDPDGGYGPANCRLATRREQARNRRCCRWVAFRGRRMVATEFGERFAPSLSSQIVLRHLANGKSPVWIVDRHRRRLAAEAGAGRVSAPDGTGGPPAAA